MKNKQKVINFEQGKILLAEVVISKGLDVFQGQVFIPVKIHGVNRQSGSSYSFIQFCSLTYKLPPDCY